MPRLQPTSAKLACTVTESPVTFFLPSWQEVAVWLVRLRLTENPRGPLLPLSLPSSSPTPGNPLSNKDPTVLGLPFPC